MNQIYTHKQKWWKGVFIAGSSICYKENSITYNNEDDAENRRRCARCSKFFSEYFQENLNGKTWMYEGFGCLLRSA